MLELIVECPGRNGKANAVWVEPRLITTAEWLAARALAAAKVEYGKLNAEYFGLLAKNDVKAALAKVRRGEYSVASRDLADKTWLVSYRTDDGPVYYHVYDRAYDHVYDHGHY